MWERNIHWLPLRGALTWGWNLKPRHVPWPGIEPATIRFAGWYLTNWTTAARAIWLSLYISSHWWSMFGFICSLGAAKWWYFNSVIPIIILFHLLFASLVVQLDKEGKINVWFFLFINSQNYKLAHKLLIDFKNIWECLFVCACQNDLQSLHRNEDAGL